MDTFEAAYPRQDHVLLHLSDTHLVAQDGTLLVLHPPPIPCIQDLAVLTELRNQPALARVVENSDVVAILAGHQHFAASSAFANVPVSVASSTCYAQDLALGEGAMQELDGAQSFNLVHLHERTVVNSVVPIGSYPRVGAFVSAEETSRRLSAAGVRIAPSISRPSPEDAGAGTGTPQGRARQ